MQKTSSQKEKKKTSNQWHIIVMVIWDGKILDFILFSLYILIFYNKQVLILYDVKLKKHHVYYDVKLKKDTFVETVWVIVM